MKKLSNLAEDKRIIIYASCLALVTSLIILIICFIFNFRKTYVLGFILSYIVNVLGFIKSNYVIDKMLRERDEHPKRTSIINTITNNLMYSIVILINLFFPCFDFVCGLIGLFMIKLVVVFGFGFFNK